MPRLCRARKTMPASDGRASVLFTCNRPAEIDHEYHCEEGRVRSKNGDVALYSFSWRDDGRQLWRQEASPAVSADELTDTEAEAVRRHMEHAFHSRPVITDSNFAGPISEAVSIIQTGVLSD